MRHAAFQQAMKAALGVPLGRRVEPARFLHSASLVRSIGSHAQGNELFDKQTDQALARGLR